MRLLFQWVLSALSLMMVAKLLPGFHIKDFGSALGVAAMYGIFHVVLYPHAVVRGLYSRVAELWAVHLCD
jgi:uncharacterized membrane protein YvlD (DUF360 family)